MLTNETNPESAHEWPLMTDSLAGLLQEALLRTDGTVTDLLELFTGEAIRIKKLSPGHYADECDWPKGEAPSVRDVILCGKSTGTRYIFAHTHLYPEVLPPAVQIRLAETTMPIGKVLRECRLEDFRQIEDRGSRQMPAIAVLLGMPPTDRMQWRRYSVISGGLVVMEITEVFSERLFNPSA